MASLKQSAAKKEQCILGSGIPSRVPAISCLVIISASSIGSPMIISVKMLPLTTAIVHPNVVNFASLDT